MDAKLYYTAPPLEQFEELKVAALGIWNSYEEPYRSEKVSRVEPIQNIQDNFMYLVAMFGINNQRKLAAALSEGTRKAVRDRMIDGGNEPAFIPF
jgi:hypothetical protein